MVTGKLPVADRCRNAPISSQHAGSTGNEGHTGQAQVMVAAVVAAGKLGHTKVLVTKISFDPPGLNRFGIGNLNFRTFLTMGCLRWRWLKESD